MLPMAEIYQEHSKTVYRYLLSLTHDESLSEELTQETFYQAIRTSQRFNESCKVTTWLCAIAKNMLLNYRRKHPQNLELEETTQSVPSAEEEVIAGIGKVELMKRVHELDESVREVIYLRIFGNLSFAEIGTILGKTENWARVTFYRGKEKLKQKGEEHEV